MYQQDNRKTLFGLDIVAAKTVNKWHDYSKGYRVYPIYHHFIVLYDPNNSCYEVVRVNKFNSKPRGYQPAIFKHSVFRSVSEAITAIDNWGE